ncbi:MAG TPA: cytochrome c [Candidatus Angelobacter sp.]|nr:cytochrome c [Candidatus Angelobacter sp.]
MKGKFTLFAVFCLAAMTAAYRAPASQAPQPQASAASRSVWDGVYSSEQAKRGGTLYYSSCSGCHGETLNGGSEDDDAPALVGKEFQKAWDGRTVNALFEKISRTMPRDNPAHLTPGGYADLVAYILSANQFPAAKGELPTDAELLKQIRIEAAKAALAR